MSKDQSLGALLMVTGLVGIVLYGWLIFFSAWNLLVLEVTGFIVVAGVLGIIVWIGYTLATTLTPTSLEALGEEAENVELEA
jgi:predicted DNA-binding transcriptional regulator